MEALILPPFMLGTFVFMLWLLERRDARLEAAEWASSVPATVTARRAYDAAEGMQYRVSCERDDGTSVEYLFRAPFGQAAGPMDVGRRVLVLEKGDFVENPTWRRMDVGPARKDQSCKAS